MGYPKLFGVPPWRDYFKNQFDFNTVLHEQIHEQRNAVDLEDRDDVLSKLLRVGQGGSAVRLPSDVELRDQPVTFSLAGHETTVSALSWTLHELGCNRDLPLEAQRAADDHTSKPAFSDAQLYRPHHFLDQHIQPNTSIPFGSGVRRCIGAGFSLMQGTVVLREILQRCSVETQEPVRNRLPNITNVPADKTRCS